MTIGELARLYNETFGIGCELDVVPCDGWRRSATQVAAFRFGRVSNSYAARTSGGRNVGVVGVALFAERGSRWTTDEIRKRDTANPFPGDRNYARPPSY